MCYSYTVNSYHLFVKKFFQILLIALLSVQFAFANKISAPLVDPTLQINLFSKVSNSSDAFHDEVTLSFGDNYNNGIDNNDVTKTNYATDNLAIQKLGYQLSAEKRKPLNTTDSIFLNITNTRLADYYFQILPGLLEPNNTIQAFLKDKYLLTETQVSFVTITKINFSINTDAASKAADRFYIFFRPTIPAGPLSVTFLSMAANSNTNKTININWNVAIEINLEHYQTEKATTPNRFASFGNKILPIGGGNAASYVQVDMNPAKGINYYRIKATSTNGQITYSNIVKIDVGEQNNGISIYPNPATGNTINLRFNDMAGRYDYTILNNVGHLMQAGNLQIAKAVVFKNIDFNKSLPAGKYYVQMMNEYGKSYTVSFNML